MTGRVLEMISRDFSEAQKELVISQLSSIELKHVMAQSENNLENTQLAILKLAQGDISQLTYFTEKAKLDFRDVIFWADDVQ